MAMEWLLRHRQPKGTETDRLPFRLCVQRPTRPDQAAGDRILNFLGIPQSEFPRSVRADF